MDDNIITADTTLDYTNTSYDLSAFDLNADYLLTDVFGDTAVEQTFDFSAPVEATTVEVPAVEVPASGDSWLDGHGADEITAYYHEMSDYLAAQIAEEMPEEYVAMIADTVQYVKDYASTHDIVL